MKALRVHKDRSLYFVDLPEPPPPGPNEIQVRMAYASICGFDMMMLAGRAAYPKGGWIGHEGSGVVCAVGSDISPSRFKPGDLVTIEPRTACGHCDACRSNQSEYCGHLAGASGLMAERVNLDPQSVYRLPPALPLQAGCLMEPLVMAIYAVKKANLTYGKNVIILGGGAMGQIILKLVRQHPVGKIVVVDPHPEKREAALRFGADLVLDPANTNLMSEALMVSGGMGYDAVIEASGSKKSAQMATNIVARGGSIVYFGLYGMDYNLELNLFNLYWKDVTVSGVGVPSGYYPAAIAMAPKLHLEEVITAMFPFDRAIEAFKEKATGKHAKVMLEFGIPECRIPA